MLPRILSNAVIVALALSAVALFQVRGDEEKPLKEADIIKHIALLTDDELVAEVDKRGVEFNADDVLLQRLKDAGASANLLAAIRKSVRVRGQAKGQVVTYQNLLDLLQAGIDQEVILKRLEKSPTTFTLDETQIQALRSAGATDKLLAALRSGGYSKQSLGDVTDLVVILDCSGSMIDKTKEGPTKMEVAQQVVTDLIASYPEGRRLCFMVYGHNREQRCEAVHVVQELAPMTPEIKQSLAEFVRSLKPAGLTPIARSLRLAGEQLAGAKGNSGLILITDGMETCNGNPAKEAAKLAENPNLTFGIHVVGFSVDQAERKAVEGIAKAGKGKFYDAQTAESLREAIGGLQKQIVKAPGAPPAAPAAPKLDENSAEVQGLIEALQDRDGTTRREAADGLSTLGVRSQKVIDALKNRVADDVWIPKPRFRGTNNACDPEAGGKEAALNALRKLAPGQVTRALQMAQKSKNSSVRAWATSELAKPSSNKADNAGPSNLSTTPEQPKKRFVGFGRSQSSGGAQTKQKDQ